MKPFMPTISPAGSKKNSGTPSPTPPAKTGSTEIPKAGTRLSGRARDEAQADAGQITIFDVIEGGQEDA